MTLETESQKLNTAVIPGLHEKLTTLLALAVIPITYLMVVLANPQPVYAGPPASGISLNGQMFLAPQDKDLCVVSFPFDCAPTPPSPELIQAAMKEMASPVPESTLPAQGNSYTVQSGDTLGRIATLTGKTVEWLAARNGIVDVNKISVGQVLLVE